MTKYATWKRWRGLFSFMLLLAAVLVPLMLSSAAFAQAPATPIQPGSLPPSPYVATGCNSNNAICNDCISATANFTAIQNGIGQKMISQIFTIINLILKKIEKTFFSGIIGSNTFQQIMGVAFLLYIGTYGMMIMFNLASYRSGEVAGRLVKLAIVYAITSPNGWVFFSSWIETPVLGGMNQLITAIADPGSGGGGNACITQGQFSGVGGTPITITSGQAVYAQLSVGPLAMLYGPMTCVFAARFVAGLEAMITDGFYGWILALLLLWGLVEFTLMIIGAILTYVKSVIGLIFLFGIAPIFFAFYLFGKSRSLTMGWLNMVLGFALQPVMLFAFLAFYATIIGSVVTNIFPQNPGASGGDICYVPWYTMPGLFSVFWWKFTNKLGAAGGAHTVASPAAAVNGLSLGDPLPPDITIINILYFLVLCNLGKNFCSYINQLSNTISGGTGAGVVTGEQVGSWFKNNITGGQGIGDMAAGAGRKMLGGAQTLTGKANYSRPPSPGL